MNLPPGWQACLPSWIDDEAKASWQQLIPLLSQMGVLTKADKNALTRYLPALGTLEEGPNYLYRSTGTPIRSRMTKARSSAYSSSRRWPSHTSSL
jgi:P27 family predicted phage terminase small subunit